MSAGREATVTDSDDGSWSGTDTDPGSAGDQATGWETDQLTSTEGQPTPIVDTSGGDDDPSSLSDIEVAFCFNDNLGYTHTVYAKSRKDAQSKAPSWNYCHGGPCKSDDALEEQCDP